MLTGYRITSAWWWRMNLLRHARIISTKTTTTKMKTTNDDCVCIRGNKKNGRGETHMSKVSQAPVGPRVRAT